MRLNPSLDPNEVVGRVLIDTLHEDEFAHLEGVLTPALYRGVLRIFGATGGKGEHLDLLGSCAEVRAARQPLPIPLVVVTHGQPATLPPPPAGRGASWPDEAVEQVWQDLQRDLVTLSPQGRLVIAAHSGHQIPRQEPQVVIDAIQGVVAAASP